MKMPAITVEFWSLHSNPSVSWKDRERRYHFWLNEDGTPSDLTIHSNPIEPKPSSRVSEHRSLKQTAARWAPLVSAIVAKIKEEGLIANARTALEKKESDARLAQIDAERQRSLERFEEALAELPPAPRARLATLPNAARIIFVRAIDNGRHQQ